MKLNLITLVIILAAVAVFIFQTAGLPWTPSRIVGLAIAAPALLLLIIARIQLGSAFSVRAKASSLVTTGLYSHICSPIYVFGGLFILGMIIWAERPRLLLIFAILIPVQIYRSQKEAEVLEAEFGTQYLEYKRRTWF